MISNLTDLMQNWDCPGPSPWSNNILAANSIQLRSGLVDVDGSVQDDPNSDALARCRNLSERAAASFGGESLHSSEGSETFQPFYVAASSAFTAVRIDENWVRRIFGRALFPRAQIAVESLAEDTDWWQEIVEAYEGKEPGPYARMRRWFLDQPDFDQTAYVTIEKELSDLEGGCCFPRLVLGRVPDGSVAGILGYVVWT